MRRPSARWTLGRPRAERRGPSRRDRPDASRRSAVNSAGGPPHSVPTTREDARRSRAQGRAPAVCREPPLASTPRGARWRGGALAPETARAPRIGVRLGTRARAEHRRRVRSRRAPRNRRLASEACFFRTTARRVLWFFFLRPPSSDRDAPASRVNPARGVKSTRRATPLSSTTRSGSVSPRTRRRSRRRTAKPPSRTTRTRAATPRSSRR